MNCTLFNERVADLAGDRLMDATLRRQLVAHSESCADCALRLEDEGRLTKALGILADQTEMESAPVELKSTLMSAFAAQQAPQQAAVSAPGLQLIPSRDASSRPQRWLFAVAAAVLLALVSAITLYQRSNEGLERQVAKNDPQVTASPDPSAAGTEQADLAKRETRKDTSGTAGTKSSPTETRRTEGKEQPKAAPAPRRLRPSTLRTFGGSTVAANTTEMTTDYIPLTYLADAASPQSGVVVRVEIPRSTLLSMGLPVNTDRGNSLVKADVVVSDDGMARAIRLVH